MNISIDKLYDLYLKLFIEQSNIDTYIITLIAGIFGFIIAAIPFTIQVLEVKNNNNIDKINMNQYMRRKIFDQYFNVLKSAIWLFLFIIFFVLFKQMNLHNCYISCIVVLVYITLFFLFMKNLFRLIKILRELVMLYLNSKEL